MEISEKALSEFKKVLDVDENKGLGVKIKAIMSKSCCSCGPSQSYEMDLVPGGEADDMSMEKQGVTFYFDNGTSELMNGCEIDFLDDHGFIVKDSGQASSCGCGDHGEEGTCC
ncbi:MAG: iron-sulfur cluster biosynthesis family protein [Nitrospirota bacterium]